MSTGRRQKNACVSCDHMVGIFTCRGCAKTFCLRHTADHRDLLQKHMNEILYNYEQLKRTIKGQTIEQYQQPLIEQVDLWEQQSMEKIRQLAEETREDLLITVRERSNNLKEKLEQLKIQLDEARQDGGFYENDLQDWSERLNELQRVFVEQQTMKIDEDTGVSSPFISRIILSDSVREDFRYHKEQHQEVVVRNQLHDLSPIKEQLTEFSTGKHSFRFKIERFDLSSSIFFGIISKSVSTSTLWNPDKINPTFSGWTEKDLVYIAGEPEQNYNGYRSDFQTGDIYMLTLNCDRTRINLINERTQDGYDLEIDTRKCPLPWLLNVRLFNVE